LEDGRASPSERKKQRQLGESGRPGITTKIMSTGGSAGTLIHMTLGVFYPLRTKRHDQNMCEGVGKMQRREEKVRLDQKKASFFRLLISFCE
jgi:hypothetical protein